MPEIPKVGWGIIGAGDIAHRVMAPAMRECPHSELVAVTRTTLQGAEDFARRHGARRGFDQLEDLLGDPMSKPSTWRLPWLATCPIRWPRPRRGGMSCARSRWP